MPPAWIDECPPLIAAGNRRISSTLRDVSAADWRAPANCEGWLVGDIAAHLAFGANYYCDAISQALSGDASPLWPNGVDGARERQLLLRRDSPEAGLIVFEEAADRLDTAYARIRPEDLDRTAWHILAPRPLWRYVAMRVYELTLHEWDLRISLGHPVSLRPEPLPVLTELLLGTLLPFTLDSAAAAGIDATFAFHFTPSSVLQQAIGDRLLRIRDGAMSFETAGRPDAVVNISLERFVLALSGRAAWLGAGEITGNRRLGEQFQSFFKPL